MKIYSCWNKIYFSSNPESFHILASDLTKKRWKILKGKSKFVHQRTDNTMAKRKRTKGNTTIYKTYIYSQRSSNTSPTKGQDELGCFIRVCRSCSTSGTSRVNLVANQIITRVWGRNREVLTISGTNNLSLWHRYYITVNQVMGATVTFSKWWLHPYQTEPLFQ